MNGEDDRRYADYLPPTHSPDHESPVPADATPFAPNVVIMPEERRGTSSRWEGLFAIDEHDGYEEFSGTRDEVITWARGRCGEIRIWSEEKQDVELLPGP